MANLTASKVSIFDWVTGLPAVFDGNGALLVAGTPFTGDIFFSGDISKIGGVDVAVAANVLNKSLMPSANYAWDGTQWTRISGSASDADFSGGFYGADVNANLAMLGGVVLAPAQIGNSGTYDLGGNVPAMIAVQSDFNGNGLQSVQDDSYGWVSANSLVNLAGTSLANQSNAAGWMPSSLGDGFGNPLISGNVTNGKALVIEPGVPEGSDFFGTSDGSPFVTGFTDDSGIVKVASPATPLPVVSPSASVSDLFDAAPDTLAIASNKMLQNFTVQAVWEGTVGTDTFTATLEGSVEGTFANPVILGTLTESSLTLAVDRKPWKYTRVNLPALTLDTATGLNIYANATL